MLSSDLASGTATRDDERLLRFEEVPSYDEFYERCLVPNRPCILPASLVAHWDVVRSNSWHATSSPTSDSQVDFEALKHDYGTHVSPVVISRINAEGQTEEARTDMTIADAVDLILQFRRGNNTDGVQSIYVKDWHLIKQLSPAQLKDTPPYTVPGIFADDWMNNLATDDEGVTDKDDFRFVYAGTRGSQTLLHRDVYTSYSWSTNVVGCKTWYLFPPHTIPSLRRFPAVSTSPLVTDVATLLSLVSDKERKEYPQLQIALSHMQTITQHAHETVFIPSNWFHQVTNLTDCISINRNWCNAVNLPSLYHSIVDELQHVENSLCDVRDMLSASGEGEGWKREFYAVVQDVAVQDAGWAWAGFWEMILHNLTHPATKAELKPADAWVRERLLPLVRDFERREDAKWLDEGIRQTAEKCRRLLEAQR
ncbi:hypothetical protein EX895_000580 [Sporisorium graminicola]|uniref:JmjC domain-containing protein n=1 Tax=Sporisorium graminicola TaxID=280036 RepID=A0A4U7L538_9BASI|nr:hypothetical protein EX895_000580 [Sporisorium graminicola]TKY90582.1 hypothetical protein EX895_000580 [Sporisorium graminicola]